MQRDVLDDGVDAGGIRRLMKLSPLLREVVADIVSGTTRAGALATVMAILVGGMVLADSLTVRRLVEDAREFHDAGAATLILTAPDAVDPMVCEALNGVKGVRAAGALRESTSEVTLTVLPASPLRIWEVSPRFSSVLAVAGGGEGPLVSQEIVDATGVAPSGWVATDSGALFAAAVYDYPADGRRAGLGWAALLPLETREPFDECWVSTWPYDDAIRQALPSVVNLDAAADASFGYDIMQLNERHGTRPPGAQTLATRATVFAPIAAAVLGAALGVLAIHTRRREFASRLHHGSHRTTVVGLSFLETWFWAGCGTGVACLAAVGVGVSVPAEDGHAIVVTGALTAAVGGASAILGALARAALVKERDLFRYFREG